MIELAMYKKLMWLPVNDKYILVYELKGCNRYIFHFDNTDIYFGFDYDNSLYVPMVCKNGRTYRNYRYIKKYAEEYRDAMLVFEPKKEAL